MPSREGSPNRNKRLAIRKLKDIYGEDFDPLQKMAEVAVAMHKVVMAKPVNDGHAHSEPTLTDYKLLGDMWEKVAQFVTPKLKAIEQTIVDDTARTRLSDTEATARLLAIFERERQGRSLGSDSGEDGDMGEPGRPSDGSETV